MKKIVALVLALVMVLSLGTVAFAQPKWEPTTARIDTAKLVAGFGKAVTDLAKMGSEYIAGRYDKAISDKTYTDKGELAKLEQAIKDSKTPSAFYASMFDYKLLAPYFTKKIEEGTKEAVAEESKEIAKDATWAAIWTHDQGVDIFGWFLGKSTTKAAEKAKEDLSEAAGKVDNLQGKVWNGFKLFADIFGKGNVEKKITTDSENYIGKIQDAIASATSQVKAEITVDILEKLLTAGMPASFTDLVGKMVLGQYVEPREPLQDDAKFKSVYAEALSDWTLGTGYESKEAYALKQQADAWKLDHDAYLIAKALFDEVKVYYQKYLDEENAQSQKQTAVTEFGAAIKAPLQIVKAFNEILAEQAQKKADKAIGTTGIAARLFNEGAAKVEGKLIDASIFFGKYTEKNTAETIADVVSYLFRILPGQTKQ